MSFKIVDIDAQPVNLGPGAEAVSRAIADGVSESCSDYDLPCRIIELPALDGLAIPRLDGAVQTRISCTFDNVEYFAVPRRRVARTTDPRDIRLHVLVARHP